MSERKVDKGKSKKSRMNRPKGRARGRGGGAKTNMRGEGAPSSSSGSVMNPIIRVRTLPMFGLRTRRRMQYFSTTSITGSASAVYSYVFSGNGAYDPDITGTGHQPLGFDQMMTFYNHYTVVASKLRVVFTSAASFPVHFGIMISGSTVYSTDYQVNVENGNMIYAVVTPSTTSSCCVTLRESVNCAKFQGIDDVMDDPNMRGDSASNPTEQLYFHCMVWNPASSSAPTGVLDAYLEYDTIFHEPRKGSLSLAGMRDGAQKSLNRGEELNVGEIRQPVPPQESEWEREQIVLVNKCSCLSMRECPERKL